jgi:hypothetical protein
MAKDCHKEASRSTFEINRHALPPHRLPHPRDRQSPESFGRGAECVAEEARPPRAEFRNAIGSTHELKVMPESNQTTESVTAAHDPFPELALDRRVDPMILWGAWLGEEPVEELMDLLG